MSDLSPYPYIPKIWNDGSGKVTGLRWTLSNSNAAIASAVAAIVLSLSIARLASLINSLLYLIFLHKRTKSTLDDQADTLVVNSGSPANLFFSLLTLGFKSRLKVLSSTVFFVFLFSTALLLPMYGVSIFTIGRIFSNSTFPMTVGICGKQTRPPASNNGVQKWENLKLTKFNLESHFSQCTDDGKRVTCFGPTGEQYSWDVFEKASYCWFGKQHCENNSRTILQRATITTENLGTTRKSRLAVTYVSECSHINDRGLIRTIPKIRWPTNITAVNESFYGFDLGRSSTNNYNNFTVLIWGSDAFSTSYSLRFWTYPFQGANFNHPSLGEWAPVPFLRARLNESNQLDNNTGTQTLTLVFNRLVGVKSAKRNNDPFFLTGGIVSLDSSQTQYLWGKPAGLLACRDQMRIHVRPTNHHPQEYTSNDVVAVGRYEEVAQQFTSYLSLMRTSKPEAARALETDWNLFAATAAPNIRLALDGLSGIGLRASEFVDPGGFQFGDNITTRAEVTRWFGVSMLYRLYSAQIFTSGQDNNWGFGVSPIPSLEGGVHWVCSQTLRMSSAYTSLNFAALIGLVVLAIIIIILSFTVEPILFYLVSRTSRAGKVFYLNLKRARLAQALRTVLQLHRIAVEKTYGYRFSHLARHEAPIYGVKAEQEDDVIGREVLYGSDLEDGTNSPGSRTLYATMLETEEERIEDYELRQLR